MKNSIVKKHRYRNYSVIQIIIFIILMLYALSLIFPILWAVNTSLKSQIEYSTYNVNGLPEQWLIVNYKTAFEVLKIDGNNFFTMIINSLWYAVGGTVIGICVSSMVAYAVAKYDFPGKTAIYYISIVMLMIPIIGSMPSQYKMYQALGILNSPMILISFAGGFGSGFLILYSFYKSLPWSFAEAAFIDGAGNVSVYFRIMLPQAITPLMSLGILSFIGLWNDSSTPLLFLKSYPTLASGLYMFQMITTRKLNIPVLYAGLLMSAIPILILFMFFSDKIMDLTIGGGLKG